MVRALLLRRYFNRIVEKAERVWDRSKRKSAKPTMLDDKLSEEDWDVVEVFIQILRPFDEISVRLQGNPKTSEDDHVVSGSFGEYFPSFEYLLAHLEELKQGHAAARRWEEDYSARLMKLWKEEYTDHEFPGLAVNQKVSGRKMVSGYDAFLAQSLGKRKRVGSDDRAGNASAPVDEYERYLHNFAPADDKYQFNPLSWWRENEMQYPNLARMATDLLSIPTIDFPEVISFDNTYSTNRFKLPLFQATGQTCLGSVFNAAFGLIDNERREGFQFLSESIRQLSEQHAIGQPDVIITDFDDQMKAALDYQFPDAQQQLYIHHINSNVLLKSKQKWVNGHISTSSTDSSDGEGTGPLPEAELSPKDRRLVNAPTAEAIPHSYRGLLEMWKLVMFAETEEDHEKAWKNLFREFDDQRAILHYLHRTYMPVRAQWARCFIRKYRNFGIRVTSGTEASNNNVKSYLLNGMSHLYRLVEAMQDMMKDQERDFKDACAADEVLTSRDYIGPSSEYLGELRTAISSKGLGLIKKQYHLARKAMPTGKDPFPRPLGDCNDDCSVRVELGIPCCHKVYLKLESAKPFTKWEVHPRWRLRESSSHDPYRRVLDPKIANALRALIQRFDTT
ncbi:transposase [Purpureocillium lilacinum]|uniref:Transposase n=1 Tax=Purpureocillium lilacinum TaxID=33203 RepID=A0A179FEQ1_PURLI|nr:transposase [Purpureocillium lilacinum]